MDQDLEKIPLKDYYVYTLTDPRSGKVFYVGKGKGERAYHHFDEINDEETKKRSTLKELLDNGYTKDQIVQVVGRFDKEREAFAVESTLIHYVFGFDSLSNIQPGHNSKFIRERGNEEVIEGIDIPKRVSLHDGSYTREKRELIEKYDLVGFLLDLKDYLEVETGLIFSDVDQSSPDYVYIHHQLNDNIQVSIGTRANEKKEAFVELQKRNKVGADWIRKNLPDTIFSIKGNGNYAVIEAKKKAASGFQNIKETFEICFREIQDRL